MKTLIIIFIILFSGCANQSERIYIHKEIIGKDLISEGATYLGIHYFERNIEPFCLYIHKFGNKTYLKKDINKECAK
jgi:hypothetical protein